MTDVINLTKKAFTWSVVVMTIAWSMGLAALAPMVANAETCPTLTAGTLIQSKADSTKAVWVLTSDLERMYFPNGDVFKSWYADFSGVVKLDADCFDTFTAATNPAGVNYRPGTYLIKFDGSNRIYAVGPDNMYHWVKSADAAVALYGEKALMSRGAGGMLTGVLPLFQSNYSAGDDIETAALHNGMLVKTADSSDVWFVKDGVLKMVDGTLPAHVAATVKTVSQTLVDAVSQEGTVPAADTYNDPTQGAMKGSTPNDGGAVVGGDLVVSLAADTPAGKNLASGSAMNSVLKFNLRAGSEAVKVEGFTFTKNGFIANTNISGIEVVDASGMRHGSVATSIDSENKVTINFGSNPIMVAAGQTEAVTVRINLTRSATSGSFSLGLQSADDVDSNASTQTGSFPVSGGLFYFIDASSSIASTTVDVQSVSGASGTTLNVDDKSSQEITKFQFSEDSSNEGVELTSLRLTNQGNADDGDYKDVVLVKADGTVLATAQPDGDEVFFNLASSPFRIDEGDNETLTVRATIVDGTTKTIQFVIEDDYDVALRGLETGAFVLPGVGSTDSSFPIGDVSGDYNKVKIGAGTLSFNKAGDSPSSAAAPGSDNVVLARFIARPTGEDYELRKVSLAIVKGGGTALTGSVKITVNGKTVYSAAASGISASSGSATSITLSSYATLKSGEDNKVEVIANIDDNATSTDSYTAYMDLTQTKKIISNTTGDPSVSQVNGNVINVDSASLAVNTLSTPTGNTTVAGVNDYHFATIELNAVGSGADVRVSSLKVTDTLGSGTDYSGVNNLRLYKDGVLVPTSNSTQTNANTTTFTFQNALVVPKDGTVTLQLKANVIATTGSSHTFRAAPSDPVSATNQLTGESVTESISGSGQTMTVSSGASVALSLVSGSNGTPTTVQVVPVGTTEGTYFSFKMTALNEAVKVTSLKLTASTTGTLKPTDVRNIRLYSSLDNYAAPFATINEFSCTSNVCTYTWSASDNLLPSPVAPGTPVTVRVKADIGAAGTANLGDSFVMSIASATGDITFKGASTGTTVGSGSISGTAAGTLGSLTRIVPFNVAVSAVSPASPVTLNTGAGGVVGVYKITNNGGSEITVTNLGFSNNGTATTTYNIRASVDGGSQSDTTVVVSSTVPNGGLSSVSGINTFTIQGGSYRYITVKTASTAENYATNDLGVNSLGTFLYSVTEANLGYSGNPSSDSDLGDTNTSLYIDGKPSTDVVTHRNT